MRYLQRKKERECEVNLMQGSGSGCSSVTINYIKFSTILAAREN